MPTRLRRPQGIDHGYQKRSSDIARNLHTRVLNYRKSVLRSLEREEGCLLEVHILLYLFSSTIL